MGFPIAARFAHPHNGYDGDQAQAARHLEVNRVYMVSRLEVGFTHSSLYLSGPGLEGIAFNTVMFEPAPAPMDPLPGDVSAEAVTEAAQYFAETWFELMIGMPDSYGCQYNCAEANAAADLYRALGDEDTADAIIAAHAAYDEEGDQHHPAYRADTAICPECGSESPSERGYVPVPTGPATCRSDWHDEDATSPGDPAITTKTAGQE